MSVQPSTEDRSEKFKIYTLKCQCPFEAPLALEKLFFSLNIRKRVSSNFQYNFYVLSVILGSLLVLIQIFF